MHVTDGAIPEEGLVRGTQHPQTIALALGQHTAFGDFHSLLRLPTVLQYSTQS